MYPTARRIYLIFNLLNMDRESGLEFFTKHVHPSVSWTVVGTHPLAAQYPSAESFLNEAFLPLNSLFDSAGLKTPVHKVYGGGVNMPWSTLQLNARGRLKNGEWFDNAYCWIVRFGPNEMVEEVITYTDSEMLKRAFEENLGLVQGMQGGRAGNGTGYVGAGNATGVVGAEG